MEWSWQTPSCSSPNTKLMARTPITVLAILAASIQLQAESPDFAAAILPTSPQSKFALPGYQVWCGSMVEGRDGKFHLFYSRWPDKLGHNAWVSHSEVARAVAVKPLGPYRHVDVVLPARGDGFWDGDCTHNPTVHRFGEKYYIYYMGTQADAETQVGTLSWPHRNHQRIGVAVADSPAGPWQRFDTPLIDVSHDDSHGALMVSNPSVTQRPDGGYLMIYKAVAKTNSLPAGGPVIHLTATSDSPIGPFTKQNQPIFTAENSVFPAEDPYIWFQDGRYLAIVKDMEGNFTKAGQSLALFESPDGFTWTLSSHPLVSKLNIRWTDGTTQNVAALERPQLWMKDGKPAVLFCAVAADGPRNKTFNVAIPILHQKSP